MTDAGALSIEEYRALLDKVFDEQVVGWTDPSPITSWWWRAAWIMTKTAGMATCW